MKPGAGHGMHRIGTVAALPAQPSWGQDFHVTSRLRSALLTGTVAAALALGAAPAQAGNQGTLGQPGQAAESAPAAGPDTEAVEAAASEAASFAAAAPAETLPAPVSVPAGAEEALADAVIPMLVEDSAPDSSGGVLDGTAGEAAGEVDGGAGEAAAPAEGGSEGEPVSPAPALPEADPSAGAGTEPAPAPAPETRPTVPVAGPAVPAEEPPAQAGPTPAAPPATAPTRVESIVVGGRTLTHSDFNIPDDIAASDEETISRWMEENIDLVLESDGMTYLVDLMLDYLMADDLDGLAALIREMTVSDPASGEELILWMYELFQGIGPDGFGDWPVDAEPEPGQAPSGESAQVLAPASLDVAPAASPAPAAKTHLAHTAVPADRLAQTGAADTGWLASGGAGLLLLGATLIAGRRLSTRVGAIR
jgi:LPXTG-motif cell wall-anchored protein